MRVLQLIDSLNPGGAERVAVSLANAFSQESEGSYLCTTREEGSLKCTLLPNVTFLFLEKKKTLDIKAVLKLKYFVKTNKITIVHAHGTSYFMATLLKIVFPKIKLIWHEHYGNRVDALRNQNKALYVCSFFFNKIIAVNQKLREWCIKNLATKNVEYLPNFVDSNSFAPEIGHREKTIICLANLRDPKNHLNLLKAFKKVNHSYNDWKLILVGKDKNDAYSKKLKKYISKNNMEGVVSVLGESNQTNTLLLRASVGVLSSDSEGLPMALLEYGATGLAVVATKAGFCEEVIGNFGKTVPTKDSTALANAILYYLKSEERRIIDAKAFQKHIFDNYSSNAILPKLIAIYTS